MQPGVARQLSTSCNSATWQNSVKWSEIKIVGHLIFYKILRETFCPQGRHKGVIFHRN